MTVQISLPREVEMQLQRRAEAAGIDVPTWIQEAVKEKLATEGEGEVGRTAVVFLWSWQCG